MIVPQPTDEQLRAAHVITFFDPNRPEFHRVIVDTLDKSQRTPVELMVVDIPVDSTNGIAVQIWLDRIRRVRPSRQEG